MMDDPAIGRLTAAVARLAAYTAGRATTGRSHDDADGVTGSVDTDDALGFDPFVLLRAFHVSGAHVVVIGQVAGIMHGSAELTGDLDVLWSGDPDQAPRLASAFVAVGAVLSDEDGRPVACAPEAFGLPKVQFRTAHSSGDCCTPRLPWGGIPVTDMLPRCRIATAADGTRISYLDLPDLIRMRRAVGRPKDLRRADELERLAGPGI
jgi:hypothetical protein